MYMTIHKALYNTPEVEAIRFPPTDEWLSKVNMVHPYNGIVFGHKKETDFCGVLQCGRTSKTWHSVKEARPRRSHATRFHLEEISRMGEPIKLESRVVTASG